ncbi:MAG: glycosyltransferase [Acidimicrobiales bacterium]
MTDGRARIRVLHLIKCLGFGGAERLLVSVSEARDRESFDYEVAYVLGDLDDLVAELEAVDVRVHSLRSRSHYDLGWLVRLRRLLLERHYDVVHLHLPYSAAFGRLVVRSLPRSSRPLLVYTQHNLWHKTEPAVRLLNRLTIDLDDHDIAVSEVARASMPPSLRQRVDVIVHGIPAVGTDGAERIAVRRELGVGEGELAIMTVANFRAEKGYPILLEAAAALVGEGLPVRFFAVGAGPLEPEVRRLCAELGLEDHFRLLGFRPDVLRLLSAADLFVLASLHEAFPVSVMEALASGVPVVATDVGAVREAVGQGAAGITVPAGDAAALAGALRALASDGERRRDLQAHARDLGARYDVRSAAGQLEDLYARLMGRRAVVA